MKWLQVIDMTLATAVHIREIGWVAVANCVEVPFVLDLGGRGKTRTGRKAYKVVTTDDEEFILTPGVIEAVQTR